jgi:hypothetical protein
MAALLLLGAATPASAGDRYALLVTGAGGGPSYALKYRAWRQAFQDLLVHRLGYAQDHIVSLAEEPDPGVKSATRDNVRAALIDFRRKATKDDLVLVLLIGHGNAEGDEAKFNLVGPDLTVDEWAALVKPIAARVVFVNGASGSFPFLRKLAAPGRIIITANDSVAQEFETRFPEFLLTAFTEPAADTDKNGRISVWEAFSYASDALRQWFVDQAQLPTERPLLDDTGAGIGREGQSPGPDGVLARATYLQADAPVEATGELAALLKQRADLEAQIAALQTRKDSLPPDEYQATLERLLLELARIDRLTRTKS